jgi:ABC-type polysaccharide/polyol phosphate export permease
MLSQTLRFSYFRSIWRCRHFWFSLVQLDLRTRYRRSILGLGWSLLNPIAMTIILCVVFHKLFKMSVVDYAPHVLCGFAVWNYITACTMQGCQSFFMGESYIRQCSMPLAIFPLRTALGNTFHFLVALGVVLLLVTGLGISGLREVHVLPLLHIIPAVVLLFFVCWSLAILGGLANVCFQDTQHLLEVGFQMFFYATPIIYKANVLESFGLGWMLDYNPVVVFLKLIRDPILEGTAPSLSTYAHALLIFAVVAGLASWMMSRFQKTLIFHL